MYEERGGDKVFFFTVHNEKNVLDKSIKDDVNYMSKLHV